MDGGKGKTVGEQPCPRKSQYKKHTYVQCFVQRFALQRSNVQRDKDPNPKNWIFICIQIPIRSNESIKAHCLQQRIQKFFTVNPQYKEYSALYTVCVLFMTK